MTDGTLDSDTQVDVMTAAGVLAEAKGRVLTARQSLAEAEKAFREATAKFLNAAGVSDTESVKPARPSSRGGVAKIDVALAIVAAKSMSTSRMAMLAKAIGRPVPPQLPYAAAYKHLFEAKGGVWRPSAAGRKRLAAFLKTPDGQTVSGEVAKAVSEAAVAS